MMKPYCEHAGITIYHGDALSVLKELPGELIQCCITSPPYWGLRSYLPDEVIIRENLSKEKRNIVEKELTLFGFIHEETKIMNTYLKKEIPEHLQKYFEPAELGLDKTPEEYVQKLVDIFREIRRVLKSNGTLWLNLGDSYSAGGRGCNERNNSFLGKGTAIAQSLGSKNTLGYKPKNLIGIPWLVAFALQADGWYLRQDIIWSKPNPIPESVTDRCTKSHEYIFLMAKNQKYYYDAEAIKEKTVTQDNNIRNPKTTKLNKVLGRSKMSGLTNNNYENRNKRSVWFVATAPYPEAHFAAFPPNLIKPMILAGCPVSGTVLDPFLGSGTTAYVAKELGRKCIGIELNEEYIKLAQKRTLQEVITL